MLENSRCRGCGTELSASLLACPACGGLVHAEKLKQFAAEAERAAHPTDAMIAWRSALELLPSETRQHASIASRIAELGREVDQAQPPSRARPSVASGSKDPFANPPADFEENTSWLRSGAAGLGAFALIAWKAKAFLLIVLTKGKLLFMGLAKFGTFSSMMLSIGVYATAFGRPLALGLVVSIYIHEMGHVASLTRYGVKASAPLFLPGIGAFVRLRQALGDPRQDARVGLAGPLWGTFAAGAAALVWVGTAVPVWGAIAKLGAAINLFNLLPFGSLDGGRAFRALNRSQRLLAAIALSLCWAYVSVDPLAEGFLLLIMIVAAISALGAKSNAHADREVLVYYVSLALALTLLSNINVPMP